MNSSKSETFADAILMDSVSVAYDHVSALDSVSLRVPAKGFVGLVGPSGAGKTSMLKAMLGLAPVSSGTVVVNGKAIRPGDSPASVGYVPQLSEIDWSFPVSVQNVVLMGMQGDSSWFPWPSRDERKKVQSILERLGIAALKDRHIRELSGGQQQRTFLARALVGDPKILILDEPTASVDIKTRDDVLHLLAELRQQGTTIAVDPDNLMNPSALGLGQRQSTNE